MKLCKENIFLHANLHHIVLCSKHFTMHSLYILWRKQNNSMVMFWAVRKVGHPINGKIIAYTAIRLSAIGWVMTIVALTIITL